MLHDEKEIEYLRKKQKEEQEYVEEQWKKQEISATEDVNNKTEEQEKERLELLKEKNLLARVVSYYQHTLGQDSRGLTYLKKDRGIMENQSLKDFGGEPWTPQPRFMRWAIR